MHGEGDDAKYLSHRDAPEVNPCLQLLSQRMRCGREARAAYPESMDLTYTEKARLRILEEGRRSARKTNERPWLPGHKVQTQRT